MGTSAISSGHLLLTGASSGIGEALARALRTEGLRLTLVARRRERLESLAAELGDCEVIAADLSDTSAAVEALAEAEKRSGPVDHLVNNAGMQIMAYGADIDPEAGERLLTLNLLTPLRLTREVLPGMKSRGLGTIVNVSSVAAFAAPLGMAWYAGSKAGLATASESLHGELRGSGVHVVTVYPGPVHTDMGAYADENLEDTFGAKLQPWATAEQMAEQIVSAMKKKRARVVYPKTYGAVRHLPGATRWALDRFSPRLREGEA